MSGPDPSKAWPWGLTPNPGKLRSSLVGLSTLFLLWAQSWFGARVYPFHCLLLPLSPLNTSLTWYPWKRGSDA